MKFTFPGRDPGGISKAGNTGFHFVTVMLLIFILLTPPASAAVISGDTHLRVEVGEITPNPARPGEDLLIKSILKIPETSLLKM